MALVTCKPLIWAAAVVALGAASLPAHSAVMETQRPPEKDAVLDIHGSGDRSTQSFTIPDNNWCIQYTYDCSNFGSKGNFIVTVKSGGDGVTDLAAVNELGMYGSAANYYHRGGTYYLEISSECDWHVTVVD